jgi:hypothetical protein
MAMSRWFMVTYLALVLYDTGTSWVLQLMHYPLYLEVGAADFSRYISANNRRAVVPAILPALATFVVSLLLIWQRPDEISATIAVAAVLLNLAVLISTAVWQGRLHGQLAQTGKSDAAINMLVTTNWIRTVAFTTQGIFAVWIISRLVDK